MSLIAFAGIAPNLRHLKVNPQIIQLGSDLPLTLCHLCTRFVRRKEILVGHNHPIYCLNWLCKTATLALPPFEYTSANIKVGYTED